MLIALPSGLLLVVIWAFFEPVPDPTTIWTVIGIMVGVFVVQLYVAPKAMIASNHATYEVSRRLRLALGNKLQRLPLGFYKKRPSDELATIVLQDVADFENIFGHTVTNIANAVFGTAVLSIILLVLDVSLALSLLAALLVAIPMVWGSRALVAYWGQRLVQTRTHASTHLMEYLRGIFPIKAYGMTGDRFQSLHQALLQLKKASMRVEAIPGPLVLLSTAAFELFFLWMIWLGLYRYLGGTLSTPVWMAFLILGYRLYEPLKLLMVEIPVLSYMNVGLTRIIDILETPEQSGAEQLRPNDYTVAFEQVHFSYIEGQPILQGIDFVLPQHTMTALVGASGSGKTTITSLIARFWDVQGGKISIGGIDVKDMTPTTVYSLVSEVFQEVYLFDGSIYENILIGNSKATEAQVMAAAQQAQVLEFAEALPEGLHSTVGEGGNQLSGGQKQRISIARALLKDAPIILLDEATASLDPENERSIQQAIQALVQNKTVLVIAHRLATITQADQILVLDQGKVAERGSHETLLQQKDGLYAHLWQLQQRTKGWKFVAPTNTPSTS